MMTMKDHDMPYTVPDGYFAELKGRLDAIPHEEARLPFSDKIKPYAVLVASFVILVTCETALLRYAAGYLSPDDGGTMEKIQLADLVPVTDPDMIYGEKTVDAEDITHEDIAAYLIDSGTTLEHIEYYENE